jgi:hypothetical protein
MPAVSKKQQEYMAMVAHGKIKGPAGLSKETAREFAETPKAGLPEHKHKHKKYHRQLTEEG